MTNEELEQIYDCLDGGFGETSGKLSAHIKALEDENERLKKKLYFEKSQAEGWRDRAEQLEHENHPEKFDCVDHIPHESEKVTYREELCVANSENCYNPLKMFYEIAEKYFATSTPQDLENAIKKQRETNVIVHKDYIEHLREENERLEDEVNRLEAAEESLADEQVKILYDRDELRKENKKLRCLRLLLASEMYWFKSVCNRYEGSDLWVKMKRQSVYYRKAYRKAKAALREGK